MHREGPHSWIGPLSSEQIAAAQEDTRSEADKKTNLLAMYPVSEFGAQLRELGAQQLFLELLPQRVSCWAEQLVGEGKLVYPDGDMPREMIPVDYRGGPDGGPQPPERKRYEGKANRGVYCNLPGGASPGYQTQHTDSTQFAHDNV